MKVTGVCTFLIDERLGSKGDFVYPDILLFNAMSSHGWHAKHTALKANVSFPETTFGLR